MESLYELEENLIGEVAKIDSSYDSKLRLAEMGVMPGVSIRMIKKTPFGGPIQVKINNYYLTLRKEDALLIYLNN